MQKETVTYPDENREQKIATFFDLDRYPELLDLAGPMLAEEDCPETVFSYATEAAMQLGDLPRARLILNAGLAVHPESVMQLGV